MAIDHPGFLEKIIEEPNVDDHRLIYSDWLEENGQQARAAFIRAQIRAWRSPETEGWNADLEEAEAILDSQRFREWFWDPPATFDVDVRMSCEVEVYNQQDDQTINFAVRRGFVSSVILPIDIATDVLVQLVDRQPIELVQATRCRLFSYDKDGRRTVNSDERSVNFLWYSAISHLPADVWDDLVGTAEKRSFSRAYVSHYEAVKGLSQALLTSVRRKKQQSPASK